MKISLLTLITPTHENVRGPSALPYYLLKYRDSDIEVEVFSFNLNKIGVEQIWQIEQSLNLRIHIWRLPLWYSFLTHYHLTMARVFFNYPLYCYIQPSDKQLKQLTVNQPDVIWHYMDTFIGVSNRLPQFKHFITGPDSPILSYFRQIVDLPSFRNLFFYLGLAKVVYAAVKQTKYPVTNNVLYHMVGREDCDMVQKISPEKKCLFLPHPHYQLSSHINIDLRKDKLKVLLAGNYEYRTFSAIDEIVPVLCGMEADLKKKFSFTFIGKNWDTTCSQLRYSGCKVECIEWVDNYVESIVEYDIFLNPLYIGSGTKGKVLDAFANELLVIGTNVALENIEVIHGTSCICYNKPAELPKIFSDIIHNPLHYENVAKQGMQSVRKYHSPQRCANLLFKQISLFCNKS